MMDNKILYFETVDTECHVGEMSMKSRLGVGRVYIGIVIGYINIISGTEGLTCSRYI